MWISQQQVRIHAMSQQEVYCSQGMRHGRISFNGLAQGSRVALRVRAKSASTIINSIIDQTSGLMLHAQIQWTNYSLGRWQDGDSPLEPTVKGVNENWLIPLIQAGDPRIGENPAALSMSAFPDEVRSFRAIKGRMAPCNPCMRRQKRQGL